MATPDQINQYYENISAPPALTPAAGSLTSNATSGSYGFYTPTAHGGQNVQFTNTGLYEQYIGGYNNMVGFIGGMKNSLEETFPQLSIFEIDSFFNSLTTANANADQYVSSGSPSTFVPGAQTAPSAVVNQGVVVVPPNSTILGKPTLPKTFDEFMQAFIDYFKPTHGTMTPVMSGGKTPLYNYMIDLFGQFTQDSTDLDFISGTVEDRFDNAFSAFLKYFPSQQLEKVTNTGLYNYITVRDFFGAWANFMTATSTVQASTQDDILLPPNIDSPVVGSNAAANAYVLNYEAIYKAFFPNNTTADFQAFFKDFYNKIISDPANGGYFLPSHFVGKFFEDVKHKYLIPFRKQNSGFEIEKPVLSIIWEVLARIKQMVDIVQQLSVYVSQRLTFLTNYQKAYTNLIATIPTVSANDEILGSTATERNAPLNNYRTTLASYRDQITAASKGVQSYLDTLSQASSNSLNQGGALITMMNGLLTILRS